jgi:hypothetical protein
MGVERAVTRWYLHRQLIFNEIEMAQVALQATDVEQVVSAETAIVQEVDAHVRLAQAQEKLKTLGPCPKPMMG